MASAIAVKPPQFSEECYSPSYNFCSIKRKDSVVKMFVQYFCIINFGFRKREGNTPSVSLRKVCANLLHESNIAPFGEFRNCFTEKLHCFIYSFIGHHQNL
jgi:hypothetical protein